MDWIAITTPPGVSVGIAVRVAAGVVRLAGGNVLVAVAVPRGGVVVGVVVAGPPLGVAVGVGSEIEVAVGGGFS
jgi:hypothetical protein